MTDNLMNSTSCDKEQSISKKTDKSLYFLGAHFSIAGGLHRALYKAKEYDCNALQIFTKNSLTWKERILSEDEIYLFEQAKLKTGISKIASHMSYLVNPAAADKKKHAMSYKALKNELVRSSMLDIPFSVLHPGSHMGKGEEEGILRIADSINKVFDETGDIGTRLLLETTAGQGFTLGSSFEQLSSIMEKVDYKNKIGICLDTCHIFSAGYDIRTEKSYLKTIDNFDAIIGLEHLYLIHLNDSRKELGSKVDRHEHIGLGAIGIKGFEYFMNDQRLKLIPKIIETPKGKKGMNWDKVNLQRLRSLVH